MPEKRVRSSASVLILMAVAAAAAILSPMLVLLPVSAQEGQGTPRTEPGQPEDPDCWEEVSSTVAQREDEHHVLESMHLTQSQNQKARKLTMIHQGMALETKLKTSHQNMVQM